MKRFITAMLTLALTTALSSEKASARDRMQTQTQLRDNGYFTGMVGKWHIGYEPAGQVEQYGVLQSDHGQIVQNDHGQTNSLVPIAGVNRSVPLAGSSENGFQRYPPLVKPKHDSQPFVTSNVDLASGHNGDPPFGVSAGDDDLNVVIIVIDDMPFLELDSSFLPWHRGYIYQ